MYTDFRSAFKCVTTRLVDGHHTLYLSRLPSFHLYTDNVVYYTCMYFIYVNWCWQLRYKLGCVFYGFAELFLFVHKLLLM